MQELQLNVAMQSVIAHIGDSIKPGKRSFSGSVIGETNENRPTSQPAAGLQNTNWASPEKQRITPQRSGKTTKQKHDQCPLDIPPTPSTLPDRN